MKVALVGEIYVAAHPQINFEIEKTWQYGSGGTQHPWHQLLDQRTFYKKLFPFKIKNKDHEAEKSL